MKRRHRLTHRRQFLDVRASKITASGGCLRVRAARNDGLPMRAGFAISGVRTAVLRNRLRRRLRMLLQTRVAETTGVDLLISAGPPAATATFAQLGADLGGCLARVVPRALRLSPPSRRSPRRTRGQEAENEQASPVAAPVR